jgi:hypothetical protein
MTCALVAIAVAIGYLKLLEVSIFNPSRWVNGLLNPPDWVMALLFLACWFLPLGWILLPELSQPGGVERLTLDRLLLVSLGFFFTTFALAVVLVLIVAVPWVVWTKVHSGA